MFERKMENKNINVSINVRKEGERTHLQNNIKTKPEQLKLSKTYPSMWP
jgi:hypothetical protein